MNRSGDFSPRRIVHSESSEGWGGQEHRVLAELKGFEGRGHVMALCAPSHAEVVERAQRAGVQVKEMGFSRLRFPFVAVAAARWLWQERVQVLNTHSSRDGWVMGVAGRLARVPLLIRSRHFDVPFANKSVSRFAYSGLADHIITTSKATVRRLISDLKISEDRITVLPTGIDVERFTLKGKHADRPRSAPEGVPLIGIIGVIRQAKGHLVLLEAARQLKQEGFAAHYWFVGDGPSLPLIERAADELGLGEQVTFAGFREDIPDIMRRLDVLVIPSLHECVPQVGLQALASKTPVVGSNVGGIPEIIRPGESGRIVPPANPAALAAAIREVFNQPNVTKDMIEKGRQRVVKNHSLSGMLDQLDELYLRCIKE